MITAREEVCSEEELFTDIVSKTDLAGIAGTPPEESEVPHVAVEGEGAMTAAHGRLRLMAGNLIGPTTLQKYG